MMDLPKIWLLMSNCDQDTPLCILACERQLSHEELMQTGLLDFEDEAIESEADPYMLMDIAFADKELEWVESKLYPIEGGAR